MPPPLDNLKQFLFDDYSHLIPQLAHANSIDDVLDVVRDHCTLINISCLESVVKRFEIKEAEKYIQSYKEIVQSFSRQTTASFCLNTRFKVTTTPSLLRCETIVFILDWDPRDCTLADIKDVLLESLESDVEIQYINKGHSIIVTCFFPLGLATTLIAKAQETLDFVKKRGLLMLTISDCIIYDKRRTEMVRGNYN